MADAPENAELAQFPQIVARSGNAQGGGAEEKQIGLVGVAMKQEPDGELRIPEQKKRSAGAVEKALPSRWRMRRFSRKEKKFFASRANR